MDTWRETLAASITRPEDLAKHLDVDPEAIKDVVGEYPMRITPMWMKLIKEKGDAIWRQVVPEPEEMADESADDPLHEDLDSPVPHLVHRYPDIGELAIQAATPDIVVASRVVQRLLISIQRLLMRTG